MNPSTQDIANAIEEAYAENIIILPNNKNIVMAAEQAAELAGDHVQVVVTDSIPQGISALLTFNSELNLVENADLMSQAITEIKTGQVTYAVRDTKIDGITIEKGNFMGIANSKIKASQQEKKVTIKLLLDEYIMIDVYSKYVW